MQDFRFLGDWLGGDGLGMPGGARGGLTRLLLGYAPSYLYIADPTWVTVSSGNVTEWRDVTGKTGPLLPGVAPAWISARAQLNNRPAVYFDATNTEYLIGPLPAAGRMAELYAYNIFVVWRVVVAVNNGSFGGECNSASGNPQNWAYSGAVGDRLGLRQRNDAGAGPLFQANAGGYADGNGHYGTVRRIAVDNFNLRVDGVDRGSNATASPNPCTVNQINIGNYMGGNANSLHINSEIALYMGVPNNANYAAIEALLKAWYGL